MTEQPLSGADFLARVQPRLREQATQLCLRPDLLDQHEALEEELTEAVNEVKASPRLGTSGETPRIRELVEQIEALEAEIEALSTWFRLRAMPKDRWTALCEQHPPRKGHEVDTYLGYNPDAVADAAVRACLYDPVFEDCTVPGCPHDDCGSWQQFVKVCNPSEWAELRECVRIVNGSVKPPKSRLAASVRASLAAGSKSPASGGSRRASSTGGRRPKSTSTSTPTGN